jgi:hypothetical protein
LSFGFPLENVCDLELAFIFQELDVVSLFVFPLNFLLFPGGLEKDLFLLLLPALGNSSIRKQFYCYYR